MSILKKKFWMVVKMFDLCLLFPQLLQGSVSGPPSTLPSAAPVFLWTSAQNPTAAPSSARAFLWSTLKLTPPFRPGLFPATSGPVGWSSTARASCTQELFASCWGRPASLLFHMLMACAAAAVVQRALPGCGVLNCRCSGPPFTLPWRGLETTQDLFR